jgi:hypothetical protein
MGVPLNRPPSASGAEVYAQAQPQAPHEGTPIPAPTVAALMTVTDGDARLTDAAKTALRRHLPGVQFSVDEMMGEEVRWGQDKGALIAMDEEGDQVLVMGTPDEEETLIQALNIAAGDLRGGRRRGKKTRSGRKTRKGKTLRRRRVA